MLSAAKDVYNQQTEKSTILLLKFIGEIVLPKERSLGIGAVYSTSKRNSLCFVSIQQVQTQQIKHQKNSDKNIIIESYTIIYF